MLAVYLSVYIGDFDIVSLGFAKSYIIYNCFR